METPHPLDRPAWSALTGRHAAFALGAGEVRRYHPAFGVFVGSSKWSDAALEALAAIVTNEGHVALLEAIAPSVAGRMRVVSQDAGVQMVAHRLTA